MFENQELEPRSTDLGSLKVVPRGGIGSLCIYHTHNVFEAVHRISRVLTFVKDTNLVYPVVYSNVSHIQCPSGHGTPRGAIRNIVS